MADTTNKANVAKEANIIGKIVVADEANLINKVIAVHEAAFNKVIESKGHD